MKCTNSEPPQAGTVGPEAERKSVCKERRKKARQRKHERGKKDKGL